MSMASRSSDTQEKKYYEAKNNAGKKKTTPFELLKV
jgi:hypothetical protein